MLQILYMMMVFALSVCLAQAQTKYDLVKYRNPLVTEVSINVVVSDTNVWYVGRSGAWKYEPTQSVFSVVFTPVTGVLVKSSGVGLAGSLLILDTKNDVWKISDSQGVELVGTTRISADGYKLFEAPNMGVVVTGNNRILGLVETEIFGDSIPYSITNLFPRLRTFIVSDGTYLSPCTQSELIVSGTDDDYKSVHQRYILSDTSWILTMEENTNSNDKNSIKENVVTSRGERYTLFDGKLKKFADCNSLDASNVEIGAINVNSIELLTNDRLALYQNDNKGLKNTEVYFLNCAKDSIEDVLILNLPDVYVANVFDTHGYVGVNCGSFLYLKPNGETNRIVTWPKVESGSVFKETIAANNKNHLMFFGAGEHASYTLNLTTGTWTGAMSRVGNAPIQADFKAMVSYNNKFYGWGLSSKTLYHGEIQNNDTLRLQKLEMKSSILSVVPVSETSAMILLDVGSQLNNVPCWFSFDSEKDTVEIIDDNWPKASYPLSISEAIFSESRQEVLAGTPTYWFDGRTDTMFYPIHGVLKRNVNSNEWIMVNEGLGTSLRCFALKMGRDSVIYMISGYAETVHTFPVPSLYTSTNFGLSWNRSKVEVPGSLGKNYKLSVTKRGVFIHDNSCYVVSSGTDTMELVDFSSSDFGTIYNVADGPNDAFLVLTTSTGVYKATPVVSSVYSTPKSSTLFAIRDNILFVNSDELMGMQNLCISSLHGAEVFRDEIEITNGDGQQFKIGRTLSAGIYFVEIGGQRRAVLIY